MLASLWCVKNYFPRQKKKLREENNSQNSIVFKFRRRIRWESWIVCGVENENCANACQSTHNYDAFNCFRDAARTHEDKSSQDKSSPVVLSQTNTKIRRRRRRKNMSNRRDLRASAQKTKDSISFCGLLMPSNLTWYIKRLIHSW